MVMHEQQRSDAAFHAGWPTSRSSPRHYHSQQHPQQPNVTHYHGQHEYSLPQQRDGPPYYPPALPPGDRDNSAFHSATSVQRGGQLSTTAKRKSLTDIDELSSSPPGKSSAMGDAGSDSRKPKRKRAQQACLRCRTQKLRCDGIHPCGRCSALGRATECAFELPTGPQLSSSYQHVSVNAKAQSQPTAQLESRISTPSPVETNSSWREAESSSSKGSSLTATAPNSEGPRRYLTSSAKVGFPSAHQRHHTVPFYPPTAISVPPTSSTRTTASHSTDVGSSLMLDTTANHEAQLPHVRVPPSSFRKKSPTLLPSQTLAARQDSLTHHLARPDLSPTSAPATSHFALDVSSRLSRLESLLEKVVNALGSDSTDGSPRGESKFRMVPQGMPLQPELSVHTQQRLNPVHTSPRIDGGIFSASSLASGSLLSLARSGLDTRHLSLATDPEAAQRSGQTAIAVERSEANVNALQLQNGMEVDRLAPSDNVAGRSPNAVSLIAESEIIFDKERSDIARSIPGRAGDSIAMGPIAQDICGVVPPSRAQELLDLFQAQCLQFLPIIDASLNPLDATVVQQSEPFLLAAILAIASRFEVGTEGMQLSSHVEEHASLVYQAEALLGRTLSSKKHSLGDVQATLFLAVWGVRQTKDVRRLLLLEHASRMATESRLSETACSSSDASSVHQKAAARTWVMLYVLERMPYFGSDRPPAQSPQVVQYAPIVKTLRGHAHTLDRDADGSSDAIDAMVMARFGTAETSSSLFDLLIGLEEGQAHADRAVQGDQILPAKIWAKWMQLQDESDSWSADRTTAPSYRLLNRPQRRITLLFAAHARLCAASLMLHYSESASALKQGLGGTSHVHDREADSMSDISAVAGSGNSQRERGPRDDHEAKLLFRMSAFEAAWLIVRLHIGATSQDISLIYAPDHVTVMLAQAAISCYLLLSTSAAHDGQYEGRDARTSPLPIVRKEELPPLSVVLHVAERAMTRLVTSRSGLAGSLRLEIVNLQALWARERASAGGDAQEELEVYLRSHPTFGNDPLSGVSEPEPSDMGAHLAFIQSTMQDTGTFKKIGGAGANGDGFSATNLSSLNWNTSSLLSVLFGAVLSKSQLA